MPSKLPPSKNSTLVTIPLELLAEAVSVTMAGAGKDAPLVGSIKATLGTVFEMTDTMTGGDVLVAPILSNTSAVSVWLPTARFTEME